MLVAEMYWRGIMLMACLFIKGMAVEENKGNLSRMPIITVLEQMMSEKVGMICGQDINFGTFIIIFDQPEVTALLKNLVINQ